MPPLSDEIRLISRGNIVVAAMIQDLEEVDVMIEIIEKSGAEIRTVSRSVKMNGTEAEKITGLRLVQEVQHRQARKTDLPTTEDVHLKIPRLK